MKRTDTNPHILDIVLEKNRFFPNSRHPVLIYKQALDLPDQKNKAARIIQDVFARNGWTNAWKNGIYDFHHYHSVTHECLGICMGKANVILGGPNGRRVKLEQGDVLILPAGVAHKCTVKSSDFLCVGAYPGGKDYDILLGAEDEYKKAAGRIEKLPVPHLDPVFGKQGFMQTFWKS